MVTWEPSMSLCILMYRTTTVEEVYGISFSKLTLALLLCNRKFWREYLPRLKYNNPSVSMIVNRHNQNEQPPTMTVYLRTSNDAPSTAAPQPASSRTGLSKAQPPASNERVVQIDMKDKHSTNILDQLVAQVGAVPLRSTPEDNAEWQSLEELRKLGNVSRERINAIKAEKRREAEMLKRARAAGGAAEETA